MPEGTVKIRKFLGTYPVSVDKQRRLTMPRAWRLPTDTDDTAFYLMPGPNHMIMMVTEERMNAVVQGLEDRSLMNKEDHLSKTFLASQSQEIQLDKQGRFQLNQNLAKYAQIEENAVFLGSFDTGTIASPNNWSEEDTSNESIFDRFLAIEDAIRAYKAKAEASK